LSTRAETSTRNVPCAAARAPARALCARCAGQRRNQQSARERIAAALSAVKTSAGSSRCAERACHEITLPVRADNAARLVKRTQCAAPIVTAGGDAHEGLPARLRAERETVAALIETSLASRGSLALRSRELDVEPNDVEGARCERSAGRSRCCKPSVRPAPRARDRGGSVAGVAVSQGVPGATQLEGLDRMPVPK